MKTTFLGKKEILKTIKNKSNKKGSKPTKTYSSEASSVADKYKTLLDSMAIKFLRRIGNESKVSCIFFIFINKLLVFSD